MTEVLLAADGFDDYGNGADAVAGGHITNTSCTIENGAISGKRLRQPSNQSFQFVWGAGGDTYLHVLWNWQTTAAATSDTVASFIESSTEHIRVAYNGNGTFTVSRAGTTVGSTPTSANMGITSSVDVHLELCARVHDTAGFYEFYVNGVLACSGGAQNLDTRNGGTAGIVDRFTVGGLTGVRLAIDDVTVYSGSGAGAGGTQTQKGMSRVITKFVNADGTNVAWTASAGTDASCVDESPGPNGDTDYISSSNVGDIDTFTYSALGLTGTVLGVVAVSKARKDDAGTRSIREVVRRSGTNYTGATDVPLGTSYSGVEQIFETDPSGGAWSVSGVDAAEFGVKVVA